MIAYGIVTKASDGIVLARCPGARVGDRVRVHASCAVSGMVCGVDERSTAQIFCDGDLEGVGFGTPVAVLPNAAAPSGVMQLGRVAAPSSAVGLPPAPPPNERSAVGSVLWTGVRAIDGLLPIARGARIGIFGSPGCGKSTLLHCITAHAHADAVVVALVGERGREAHEWQAALSPHVAIVCATSDRCAGERIRAAESAMGHAHALAARGLDVLLVLDSLARYAYALRERAIACDEPVGRGGFSPSVFAQLARYAEVAGARKSGSITLLATVLSDGDERDPVSECARSILDGHIELSANLAGEGRFPAIDVCASVSRTANVARTEHLRHAQIVRRALASLERSADARSLGIPSTDPALICAVAAEPQIRAFLEQPPQAEQPAQTLAALAALADILR